jgi:hypothetical protein
VYRAIRTDGRLCQWDNKNENWYRPGQNELVALKSLNNSKNVTLEFINEVNFIKKKVFYLLYLILIFLFYFIYLDYITY